VIDKILLVKFSTRQRPLQSIECLSKAKSLAYNPTRIKWLISLDTDDPTSTNLGTQIKSLIPEANIYYGVSHSKIHANNRDVNEFSVTEEWDILLNLSDDQICAAEGWDNTIRESMHNDLDRYLWFYDGLQSSINTQEIVGRNYYKRTGKIYHDGYKSFYCDEEATIVAQKLGKMVQDKRCLFKHNHPAGNASIKNDDLYNKNQQYWNEDKRLFLDRWHYNFYVGVN
jgi:hypothetical protein